MVEYFAYNEKVSGSSPLLFTKMIKYYKKNYTINDVLKILLIIALLLVIFLIVDNLIIHDSILELEKTNIIVKEKLSNLEICHIEKFTKVDGDLTSKVNCIIDVEKKIGVKEPAKPPTNTEVFFGLIWIYCCFYALIKLSFR